MKTAVSIGFDVMKIRKDFPILNTTMNGQPLVYFDNGASSQKPESVIQTLDTYYRSQNANVHRGVYTLSQIATDAFDQARHKIARYINSPEPETVIFTSGTTESINLVAQAWGREHIQEGDVIICTEMEHHSNMVPWQMLAHDQKAKIKYIPLLPDGTLDMEVFGNLLSDRVKLVALSHVSNTLGVINPVEKIIGMAHQIGAKVLIDGAQALPHFKIDVQSLDADFYAFSGHKILGPTGIGILYGKKEILETTRPYKGGGDMIDEVTLEGTTYANLPFRFEAGTPNIAGAIGLGAAIDYMEDLDWDAIETHESELYAYLRKQMGELDDVLLYGDVENKVPVLSFNVKGLHPFDVGTLLDQMGIATRTGHHCTQPIMTCYGIPGTVRASLGFYNTLEEIDRFVTALKKAIKILTK
jgi:cysteine desulfurase/selenocysteine lyase